MKKNFVTAISIGLTLGALATPTYAIESQMKTASFSTDFSAPVLPSKAELKAHQKSIIQVTPQKPTSVSSLISFPELTSPLWSYSGLWPHAYIDTQATYTLSAKQQVVIKCVQYPDAVFYGGIVAKASYQLVAQGSGVTTSPYQLEGNYDSTTATFSFFNVPAGKYKLRIWNDTTGDPGATDMAGNGYVYYY